MRASTAYFAGAGTVIAAIAGGVGGGLLFADIVSPQTPKQELTRLEQRMSAQPIQVKTGSEPAATSTAPPSTTAAAPAIPAPEQPPAQNTAATPAPDGASPGAKRDFPPAAASTAETPAATQPPAAPAPSEPKASPPAQKQAATVPEDSLAKARDVDIKRAATEKRRTERRQQWSEKRRSSSGRIRIRSCARSSKRCGRKPKPGRSLPPSRRAPRCRGSVCSIWIELTSRHSVCRPIALKIPSIDLRGDPAYLKRFMTGMR